MCESLAHGTAGATQREGCSGSGDIPGWKRHIDQQAPRRDRPDVPEFRQRPLPLRPISGHDSSTTLGQALGIGRGTKWSATQKTEQDLATLGGNDLGQMFPGFQGGGDVSFGRGGMPKSLPPREPFSRVPVDRGSPRRLVAPRSLVRFVADLLKRGSSGRVHGRLRGDLELPGDPIEVLPPCRDLSLNLGNLLRQL